MGVSTNFRVPPLVRPSVRVRVQARQNLRARLQERSSTATGGDLTGTRFAVAAGVWPLIRRTFCTRCVIETPAARLATRDDARVDSPRNDDAAVAAMLDPVLTRAGFSGAQGGGEETLWCMSYDDLADHYPDFPQVHDEHQQMGSGRCVDLMLAVTSDGRVESLILETLDVDATLRAIGADRAAEAVRAIIGKPLNSALPTIRTALERLFPTG